MPLRRITMLNIIENQKAQIVSLCKRYPIERLSVFGSAVRGDFVPGKSDIDFLVRIAPCDPVHYADVYFALQTDLEHLLANRIDLITEPSVTNPYVLRSIREAEQEIYVNA